MGRFKGGATHFHSIGQNIMVASKSYKYQNGRFGVSSPSTGNYTRNISSSNPLYTAKDFYDKIAKGGVADGSSVAYRVVSSSDGTPVVEISIRKSKNSSGVKAQKIHFIKE